MGEVAIKPRLSYSAISVFEHCQYQYYLKYIQKQRSKESTLALEVGTLAHKIKELISLDLMACESPNYQAYWSMFWNGYTGTDKSSGQVETIKGAYELSDLYADEWNTRDNKTGMTYAEKAEIFKSHLRDEQEDFENWFTIGVEVPFEFTFEDWAFIGFIDRLSMNAKNQIAIRDYKTSKSIYADDYIRTPLQMLIYDMAVRQMYPEHEIIGHTYDFIFLGQTQEGGTPGWLKRGEKKLHNLLAKLQMDQATGIWEAKPSPLCHYCDFCVTKDNPDHALSKLCPYYSLWTPDNKTYNTNRKWDGRKAEDIFTENQSQKKQFKWD